MIESTPSLLISGATGMIGSLLTAELASWGVPFRAMVRSNADESPLGRLPGASIVTADFDDPDSLVRALEGVERAFLLTNSSERTEAQQKSFVHAAQEAGVRHIVKLSQLAAEADSPVRFLRYHAAVEAAIRDSGLDWTFLRPNLIMQAYLPFGGFIARGTLPAPIGEARISMVDARDIAEVAAKALIESGHAGQTYTLTGPKAVSHAEIAAAFGAAAGHEVRFEPIPPDTFGGALTQMGMPAWQAEGLLEDYAHYERGEAAFISPDIEAVTGHSPRSLAAFARDHADAFRSG
ncbi:SDR family oxidoreductase [bacterium]|nr:MAG: SDR family oxidoreductase [bacterium]